MVAPSSPPVAPAPAPDIRNSAGFALVEMLVAMLLLSLVGLTLARFQTFQLAGTRSAQAMAAARLVADNRAVDIFIADQVPGREIRGSSTALGTQVHWTIRPQPAPASVQVANFVAIDITTRLTEDGPVLAQRQLLRPKQAIRPETGNPSGRGRAPAQ